MASQQEELEKAKRKRGHVLDEIWKSEQSYVAGLDSLYENFYQPCVKFAAESSSGWLGGGSIITESEVQMVFPYVPAIRDCNHILLKQLDAEFAKSTDNAEYVILVGPIFQRFAPVLKIYTEFMNNYQVASDTMERLCASRVSLKEWRESVELRLMTPLGQLMITPVQRIPRYKLLLAELIKYTPVRRCSITIPMSQLHATRAKERDGDRSTLILTDASIDWELVLVLLVNCCRPTIRITRPSCRVSTRLARLPRGSMRRSETRSASRPSKPSTARCQE